MGYGVRNRMPELKLEEIDKLAFDRNSIEESFNQYENLDKFLENDRKQEERR